MQQPETIYTEDCVVTATEDNSYLACRLNESHKGLLEKAESYTVMAAVLWSDMDLAYAKKDLDLIDANEKQVCDYFAGLSMMSSQEAVGGA